MSTTSITKEFYAKDRETFEKLEKHISSRPAREHVVESASLKRGREKLATFVFR